ncbi:flavin monoamine oxidase family protein [Tenacibaculum sp. C7A-26P2]|uniref:flavin monoamine oxidase family protein n=1 Tax=Tenacibaculum sp. C7A-26P2 TaxID=3447504 RepID=UPI003F83F312
MKDVIVIGGGLAGLTTAHLLKDQNLKVQILEANTQLGGRIKTVKSASGFGLEMGATWVFNDPFLKQLIQSLNIELYPQYITGKGFYEMNFMDKTQVFDVHQMMGGQEYHKVAGGTYEIIKSLEKLIGTQNIELNSKVTTIQDNDDHIEIITSDKRIFKAKNVVITIPPRLLASTINFSPNLSENSKQIRLKTHTWMADSVKFSIEYKEPFWRAKGLAGYGISNIGIVREFQDHVNNKGNLYGLVGFLNLSPSQLNSSEEERKNQVIKDLSRIIGNEAKNYVSYKDTIWAIESMNKELTNINEGLYAHQHNGDREIISPEMGQKLFFAGAETSTVNPGYMEGAVKSAYRATKEIISKS